MTTSSTDSPAIGIDLGTTNSCVAVCNRRDGRVDVLVNAAGDRTTPSWVAFTDEERLVGLDAKSQGARNAENTVFSVKRLIGRSFSDPSVQQDVKMLPFKVINDSEGQLKVQVRFKGEEKTFSPEEISAAVLSKMKESAEACLGQKITRAVISVPAYFNDSQRQATKDAGKIAQLDVVGIVAEPTAAAIAYRLDKGYKGEKNVLIFDLGGGTFDVSIVCVQDVTKFVVLSTEGVTHLGGEDFDNRLVDFFMSAFLKQIKDDKKKEEAREDKKVLRKLRIAAEIAKKNLSTRSETLIEVDSLYDNLDFYTKLTRAKFEDLCDDLFKQTLDPVKKALDIAKLDKSHIDQVVLVGGSTRIPQIQNLLLEFFNIKELNKSINPDEAVAYGAAVQAAILTGDVTDKLKDVRLVELCPMSIGIETAGGLMTAIIPRGTPIPASIMKEFPTFYDNQEGVDIELFEGEEKETKRNHKLGMIRLSGIPPGNRGIPRIQITFDLDANGILKVSARDKFSKKEGNLSLDKGRLAQGDIDKMASSEKKVQDGEKGRKERAVAREEIEKFALTLKRDVKNPGPGSDVPGKEDALLKVCEEIETWLTQNAGADKATLQKRFEELKEQVLKVKKG